MAERDSKEGSKPIARRDALLTVVKTTGYAVPIATLLLSGTQAAKAGIITSLTPG